MSQPQAVPNIADAIEHVTRTYQEARRKVERREAGRIEFIQPVQVETEDGRLLTLLSRDISASGIRLIGTQRLLGQKISIRLCDFSFTARVLWSCPIGDDLVENGGNFLGVRPAE
jgi:hypothetical protein